MKDTLEKTPNPASQGTTVPYIKAHDSPLSVGPRDFALFGSGVEISRVVFFIAAAAVLSMLVLNLSCRKTYEGDEGFYGVTALNMVQSPAYLLRPSYYPEGNFLADKNAFAHPPWNSYFYALALWIGGGSLVALDFLTAFFFAALLYFVWRVLATRDRQAAAFAVVLLAVSPAIHTACSQLEAEPLMTTFGLISLYCAVRAGFEDKKLLFLSGLAMGMAFALKLWLSGPLGLAVGVALLLAWKTPPLRRNVAGLALFFGGALLPSALHLLATATFYPQDLAFWLKNIYFGIFTNSGISGAKFGPALANSDWVHPWWYYGATLYRDHFFLFPAILLGGCALLRNFRTQRELLCIILAGVAGLLPLSLMSVKEPQYILTCTVFLYGLAGLSLAALTREGQETTHDLPGRLELWATRLSVAAIVGLLLIVPVAYSVGIQPRKITLPFVIGHSVTLTVLLIAFCGWRRDRSFPFARAVYAGCFAALLACSGHAAVTRFSPNRAITDFMMPYVQDSSTRVISFVGSNFKAQQLTTFRKGCYWEDLPKGLAPERILTIPKFRHIRLFIIDAKDQRNNLVPHWIAWLEKNAVEKTAEFNARLGATSGWRVFVRNDQK